MIIDPQTVVVERDHAWARAHDQFFTRLDVAVTCLELVEQHLGTAEYVMLEPSAGRGAFFDIMPLGSVGVDIDPGCDGVYTADFLEVEIVSRRKVLALGNPPFGRQASLARGFFNHLASHPQVEAIAFVLPRSFRKAQVQRQLDPFFHLLFEWEVPTHAFLFEGKPYNVPAVFMIWVRRPERRATPIAETEYPDFDFVKRKVAEAAFQRAGEVPLPFALQRVGNAAGTIHHDFNKSDSSHLFVCPKISGVEAIMRRLQPDFRRVSHNVAGNPSIAKSEIVSLYKAFVGRRVGAAWRRGP